MTTDNNIYNLHNIMMIPYTLFNKAPGKKTEKNNNIFYTKIDDSLLIAISKMSFRVIKLNLNTNSKRTIFIDFFHIYLGTFLKT